MRIRLMLGVLLTLVVAIGASVGADQQQGTRSPEEAALDMAVLPDIGPSQVWTSSDFQTGGTGLRNQRRGGIMINGVPGGVNGPIRVAYLYWAIITNGPSTATQRTMIFRRRWPTTALKPASVTVAGAIVGTAGQPCWTGTTITVLKADVSGVVTGSGAYEVQPKVGGSYAGADPWVSSPGFPLHEGASLVVVYPAVGTTSIYDVGLTATFSGALNYALTLPFAATSIKMDLIGADGQFGSSRSPGFGVETTTVNGVALGTGSPWSNSLWNGYDGLPLPQLWDTHGRQFNIALSNVLNVNHTSQGDCLTTVANIVKQ